MRALIVLAFLVLFGTACAGRDTLPALPDVVRVPVSTPRPLPDWATAPLPVPVPVDGTVGARAESHDLRGAVIELANCHRRLAARLSRGEVVDALECAPAEPLW